MLFTVSNVFCIFYYKSVIPFALYASDNKILNKAKFFSFPINIMNKYEKFSENERFIDIN